MDQSVTEDTGSPYVSDQDAPSNSSISVKDISTAKLSNGGPLTTQEDNKFQSAISAWRSEFFLGAKHATLKLMQQSRY